MVCKPFDKIPSDYHCSKNCYLWYFKPLSEALNLFWSYRSSEQNLCSLSPGKVLIIIKCRAAKTCFQSHLDGFKDCVLRWQNWWPLFTRKSFLSKLNNKSRWFVWWWCDEEVWDCRFPQSVLLLSGWPRTSFKSKDSPGHFCSFLCYWRKTVCTLDNIWVAIRCSGTDIF